MQNYYFKIKVIKMGKWATPPLDAEAWHGLESSKFFKKTFGIYKGLLALHTREDGYMHMYVPNKYFVLLHKRIRQINTKNYKALGKKLLTFYSVDKLALKAVQKIYHSPQKLSNTELASAITRVRQWIHRITVYDQFGWLAEEYWTPLMRNVLENKLKIAHGSEEYNRVLFALAKPARISTTLSEKKAVLEQTIKIKNHKQTLPKAADVLSRQFGWLPIFNYGDPWDAKHYSDELKDLAKKDLLILKNDFNKLKNYTSIRNHDIADTVKQYKINNKDSQIFIEFGLTVDTRNEAEYFCSYAGQYLMPLLKEAGRRLYLSSKQLRSLTEQQIKGALAGKINPEKLLRSKGKYDGWGYDKPMKKQLHFSSQEAEKLFKFIESYVKPIQGGDENRGTCASPGKVTGKIRIVPYPKDNYKVKQGDILVTYATTTDYLPAMKRAAAIITEVGGLTCHAAVVSREFNIPCIVALKNAMKNFRDGEMVEVDANRGVVKKLK